MPEIDISHPNVDALKATVEARVQDLERKLGKEDAKIDDLVSKIRAIIKPDAPEMNDEAISYKELFDAFQGVGIKDEKYEEYAKILGVQIPMTFHYRMDGDRKWVAVPESKKPSDRPAEERPLPDEKGSEVHGKKYFEALLSSLFAPKSDPNYVSDVQAGELKNYLIERYLKGKFPGLTSDVLEIRKAHGTSAISDNGIVRCDFKVGGVGKLAIIDFSNNRVEVRDAQPVALQLLAQDFKEIITLGDNPGEFTLSTSYYPGIHGFGMVRGIINTTYSLEGKILKVKNSNGPHIEGDISVKKMAGALQILTEFERAYSSQKPGEDKEFDETQKRLSAEYKVWMESKN